MLHIDQECVYKFNKAHPSQNQGGVITSIKSPPSLIHIFDKNFSPQSIDLTTREHLSHLLLLVDKEFIAKTVHSSSA